MLEIMKMQLKDIPQVLNVENFCFSTPWNEQQFRNELINNKLAIYLVLKKDNKVIGYVGVWQVLDEGHITNIAIHPMYQGKKYSKILLDNLLEVCQERDIKAVTLEVREHNIRAQKLYKQYEFEIKGIRKNYYDNPKEDAYIMWKQIQGGLK